MINTLNDFIVLQGMAILMSYFAGVIITYLRSIIPHK